MVASSPPAKSAHPALGQLGGQRRRFVASLSCERVNDDLEGSFSRSHAERLAQRSRSLTECQCASDLTALANRPNSKSLWVERRRRGGPVSSESSPLRSWRKPSSLMGKACLIRACIGPLRLPRPRQANAPGSYRATSACPQASYRSPSNRPRRSCPGRWPEHAPSMQ